MSAAGICSIKPQFIVAEQSRQISLECVSEADKVKLTSSDVLEQEADNENNDTPSKRPRLSKKLRGQNKSRGPTFKRVCEIELCNTLISCTDEDTVPQCEKKNCTFIHDIEAYLQQKPKDIGTNCYNYQRSGCCSRGIACRFGSEHITEKYRNKIDKVKYEEYLALGPQTTNSLKYEVQNALRKRTYDFSLSEALIKFTDNKLNLKEPDSCEQDINRSGCITDEDIIKVLQREKKTINWKDKLFLSPLTTVGNLPFRRICKEFGADVTCGEMAMCSSLLQGAPQEWALVKRHKSEDIFGVQLCANNPHLLTKCCQMLQQETDIDFVDLNLGCPIELVYRQGGGCGLLRRGRALESCIKNMSQILTVPLTVKTRTGVYSNESIAHKLVPKFREWGASLVTVHGRSREQRYTKQADWEYIRKCAQAADPLPVVGNGDILSYEDYKVARETCPELTSIMIGRGALIKPWIFTEIKEQKLWDISSSERFEILQKYANYGLEHWGSDTKGVENTRRFLLEWLSFLHRYVPVGLLERPPQKINERPPFYRGRDDLETLMASTAASDWIKISEMLLGPVPKDFVFLPKHKANSYK